VLSEPLRRRLRDGGAGGDVSSSRCFRLALLLLGCALLAGCGDATTHRRTQLTLLALNTDQGRALIHIDCSPPSGDLPHPQAACSAIEHHPQLVTNPTPFNCWSGSSWDVTISGRLDGRPVSHRFSTCWAPQQQTIARLGLYWPVLLAHTTRRAESVPAYASQRLLPVCCAQPTW
jgi:hypothetical protein